MLFKYKIIFKDEPYDLHVPTIIRKFGGAFLMSKIDVRIKDGHLIIEGQDKYVWRAHAGLFLYRGVHFLLVR